MFSQLSKNHTMAKTSDTISTSINLIGAGTVIEGEIKSNGDIRIDGTIYGSIISKAKVVIGSTGHVKGDITCQNADISGTIEGKTNVSDLLFLKASSKLNGDIFTGKLVVEAGSSFTGSCNMGAVIKDIKHGDKPGEIKQKEKIA